MYFLVDSVDSAIIASYLTVTFANYFLKAMFKWRKGTNWMCSWSVYEDERIQALRYDISIKKREWTQTRMLSKVRKSWREIYLKENAQHFTQTLHRRILCQLVSVLFVDPTDCSCTEGSVCVWGSALRGSMHKKWAAVSPDASEKPDGRQMVFEDRHDFAEATGGRNCPVEWKNGPYHTKFDALLDIGPRSQYAYFCTFP